MTDALDTSEQGLRHILATSYATRYIGGGEKPSQIRTGGSPSIPADVAIDAMRFVAENISPALKRSEEVREELVKALGMFIRAVDCAETNEDLHILLAGALAVARPALAKAKAQP